jgi:hypothetical protein
MIGRAVPTSPRSSEARAIQIAGLANRAEAPRIRARQPGPPTHDKGVLSAPYRGEKSRDLRAGIGRQHLSEVFITLE